MFQAAFRLPAKFYGTFLNLKRRSRNPQGVAQFRPKKKKFRNVPFHNGWFMSTKLVSFLYDSGCILQVYVFCGIVGPCVSPVYHAVFHLDVRSRMDKESVGLAFQETFSVARTFVVDSSFEGCPLMEVHFYLVEVNPVDFVGGITTHKDSVFTRTFDVVEINAAYFSAGAFHGSFGETPSRVFVVAYSPRIGGDINGFSLAPPYVGEEAAVDNHVRENHVGHRTFVTVLYADSPVAVLDDAVGEQNVVDFVHVLRTDFYGAGT